MAAHAEFEKANRLHAPDFNRATYSGFLDELIGAFTTEFFAVREGWGADSERPVFIVGLPRSGTSLVEQILASHPLVHGAGELTDIGRLAQSLRVLVRSGKRFLDFTLDVGQAQVAPWHRSISIGCTRWIPMPPGSRIRCPATSFI